MEVLKRSRFDKLLEKATSDTLTEPDLETILTICDLIRGQEISAKLAVQSVKRRLQHENATVVLHAVYVLEAMMKNCGNAVHEEVATTDFMQTFSSLINKSFDVRSKVLACIHNWAYVFKGKPGFSAIQDTFTELKSDGCTFPPFSENDAMFSVACAPNWKEETSCHRCKVAFGAFRRRHHCRNCGNSFCADCSSERAVLPQFGIEKEVRVCDHCFEQLAHPSQEKKPQADTQDQTRREQEQRERDLATQEAEELQLALALSASEAESKERERRGIQPTSRKPTEPKAAPIKHEENGRLQLLPVLDTTDMDPELARYLNRHYWDNRAAALANQSAPSRDTTPQPSAPIYASLSPPMTKMVEHTVKSGNENNAQPTGVPPGVPELTDAKQEEFLAALRASIEFFVNRMQSDNQRGRSIANDTTVQTLFITLHEMHPQLLQYKQAMEDRRAYFEGFQDKLTQLREAREALDALRQEHAARRQLEEQEAARLRQLQMMQKLEIMRQQKRETLEYRRRLAMEQTMQYQQQYHQPQAPPSHGQATIDPATGMPITYPGYPPGMQQPNYAAAQSGYGEPGGAAQPAYYPGQYAPMHYAAYGGQQPTNQPMSYGATPQTGVYQMMPLEAALPQPGPYQDQYSAAQPEALTSAQYTTSDLPEPPTNEPRPPASTTPQAKSQCPEQLISFD